MKIRVLSQNEFHDLMKQYSLDDDNVETKAHNAAFICIKGSGDSHAPWFERDHSNVMTLFFDDLSREEAERVSWAKLFTPEMAEQILKFAHNNRDKEYIAVHCHAGISRSGAVGKQLNFFFDLDERQFMLENKFVKPNPWVNNLMFRAVMDWEDTKE